MTFEEAVHDLINVNVHEVLFRPVGDRHFMWYPLTGPTTTALATGFISGDGTEAYVIMHTKVDEWCAFVDDEAKELCELGWSHTPIIVTAPS